MIDVLIASTAGLWILAVGKALLSARARRVGTKAVARLGVTLSNDKPKGEKTPLLAGLAGHFEGTRFSRYAAERHPSMLLSDYMAVLLIGAIGGGIVGALVFGWGPPALLAIAGGPVVADRVALQLASRRSLKLEQQLPEALALQAAALRAGRSTLGSLRSVASDVKGKLKEELERTLRQVDLGRSLDGGLESLVRRSGSRDVEIWVTAMLVHRQTGGNLATVVDSLSERVRERSHMRAELRALTAQGRLSGIVIAVAPIAFFLVLSISAREQMRILYSTPVGLTLLLVGLSMEALGFLWIRHILRIKA